MTASLATHLRTLADAAGGVRPLARLIGVHWTTLHRWLAGTQHPTGLVVRLIEAMTAEQVRRARGGPE